MTPAEITFAQELVAEARASGHPWPGYAAAEAFLESASWGAADGKSGLAENTNDVFGLKQPSWWTGQVYDEQTREVVAGVSEMVDAEWPIFPSLSDCFAARLRVLSALPLYAEALAATTGEEFIRLVSASWSTGGSFTDLNAHPVIIFTGQPWQFNAGRWSTDPRRAAEVLLTWKGSPSIFQA